MVDVKEIILAMCFRSTVIPLLLLVFAFQPAQESFQKQYEVAEAHRRAGDLRAAESEYAKILATAYGKLGKIHLAQKNYSKAALELEAAMLHQSDLRSLLVDLAVAYFYTEQYQKALEPLNKAVGNNPQNAGAHHMLGKTYFMLGEFGKSASELETALKLSPNDFDASYTLGLAFLKQRQLAPARRIYERMLRELGDRPQLRVLIGRAYRETDFLTEAIEEFKRAIALDPAFPRVHYYLGLTYLMKDGVARLGDAKEEFNIELRSHPDEFFANYYLGIVFLIERRWELAASFLRKASRIEPDNPDPYFHLSEAYQGLQRPEQAIEVLNKAIALSKDVSQMSTARYRLGQSLVKIGQTEAGQKELQIAAELKSKGLQIDKAKLSAYLGSSNLHEQKRKFTDLVSVEGVIAESKGSDEKTWKELEMHETFYAHVIASAHNNIGLLRAERQDFSAAARHFAMAAKMNPHLERINYNLGLAYYKSESYKEAVAALESELKADPANLPAQQLLGMSYFLTHNYPEAAALLTEILEVKPNEVTLYYPLALSLSKEGKKDAVNRVIGQMVTRGVDSPQVHILLGQAYYEQNDTAKALEELQTALSLNKRVNLAHFYSGMIYLKMGKLDEATREFEAELDLNPGDTEAKYHLAYVLLARQDTPRGIKLLREVIQAKPDFGNARFELGKVLLQQGDVRAAVDSLELAAKLEPGQAHVHYQLGRAYIAAGRHGEGESQFEISRQLKEKARKANQ